MNDYAEKGWKFISIPEDVKFVDYHDFLRYVLVQDEKNIDHGYDLDMCRIHVSNELQEEIMSLLVNEFEQTYKFLQGKETKFAHEYMYMEQIEQFGYKSMANMYYLDKGPGVVNTLKGRSLVIAQGFATM